MDDHVGIAAEKIFLPTPSSRTSGNHPFHRYVKRRFLMVDSSLVEALFPASQGRIVYPLKRKKFPERKWKDGYTQPPSAELRGHPATPRPSSWKTGLR